MTLLDIMQLIHGGGGSATLQTKTATPSKTEQTVEPDEGYDGLSAVTVSPIPAQFERVLALSSTTRSLQWFTESTIGSTRLIRLAAGSDLPVPGETVLAPFLVTDYYDDTDVDAYLIGAVVSSEDQQGALYTTIRITERYIDLTPGGVKTITENGTHDVAEFVSAQVNVQPTLQSKTVQPAKQIQVITPDTGYYGLDQVTVEPAAGGDIDAILDGSVTSIESDVTETRISALYWTPSLETVRLPRCLKIGAHSLQTVGATVQGGIVVPTPGIEVDIYAPVCQEVETYGLASSNFKRIHLPECTKLGDSAMALSLVEHVRLPKLATYANYAIGSNNVISADFGLIYSIISNLNSLTTAMKLVALRRTQGVISMTLNSLCQSAAPLRQGTGFVLVPRSLISNYTSATNWSALYTAGTQFLALEDYTQDGTTSGELDEDKIDVLLAS